jgi:hypothetical protein
MELSIDKEATASSTEKKPIQTVALKLTILFNIILLQQAENVFIAAKQLCTLRANTFSEYSSVFV